MSNDLFLKLKFISIRQYLILLRTFKAYVSRIWREIPPKVQTMLFLGRHHWNWFIVSLGTYFEEDSGHFKRKSSGFFVKNKNKASVVYTKIILTIFTPGNTRTQLEGLCAPSSSHHQHLAKPRAHNAQYKF